MIYRKSIYENTISMPISHFKYWITINAANVIYAWIIEYSTLFTMLQLWGKFRTFADAMEKKSLKGSEHELRTRICMRPNWLKRITKHRSHNYSYIRVGAKMFIFSIQSFKSASLVVNIAHQAILLRHAAAAIDFLGIIILCSHVCSLVRL